MRWVRRVGEGGFRWIGRGHDAYPRVLGYHSVGDGTSRISVSRETFLRQIQWLVDRRTVFLTISDWWRRVSSGQPLPPRTVLLTFDDGYLGVWRAAAPVLADYGIRATLFVVTDRVGTSNRFDPKRDEPELPLMSWPHLRQLAARGWDVQSHSRSHRRMVDLHRATLDDELIGSKHAIEQRIGRPVEFFCYPYGAFDRATIQSAKASGYVAAFTTLKGVLPAGRTDDSFRLRRVIMEDVETMEDFVFCFSPGYRWMTLCWWGLQRVRRNDVVSRREDRSARWRPARAVQFI